MNQNLFKDISHYVAAGGIIVNETVLLAFFVFSLIISTLISLFLVKKDYSFKKSVFKFIPFLLYFGGIVLGAILFFIISKSNSSIFMFISEEVPGVLFFFEQNGLLLFLVIIALVLLPFAIKYESKNNLRNLFLFFILIASSLMAAYQLKHMLLFGVIASIGVGFTINEIFKLKEHKIKFDLFSQKFVFNKSTIRKCFILLLVILLFGTLIAGFNTVNHIEPVTKKLFGVKEASIWLHNNSIEGAKIFSWWDAGHLITFFAERKVACDNRNYFGQLSEVNKNVAEFFLTEDINKGRDLIRKYAPDYLVIYPQLFTQGRVLKAYYNGPQMALDSNLNYNYYGFCKRIDENIVCDGKVLVDYRENKSDFWSLVPNASIGGVKYYFYLGEDFYYMIDEETNNSNLAKIYFESEETSKYYEKVYSQFGTRIFKIKK